MDTNTENDGLFRSWMRLNIDKPVESLTNDELAVVEIISFYAKWASLSNGADFSYWKDKQSKVIDEYTRRIKKIVRGEA